MDANIPQNKYQLFQGQRLDNQINNTLIECQTSGIHSQSDLYDDSRIEQPLQKQLKNDSNDKESISLDLCHEKITFQSKEVRGDKKHKSSLKTLIPEKNKDSFVFICFGEKKIELTQDQLNNFLIKKYEGNYCKSNIKCRIIIEEVIRKLCITQFNFDPISINIDTFNIVQISLTSQGDKTQKLINNSSITQLTLTNIFHINRIARTLQFPKYYQQLLQKSKQLQIIQIISADQRDLIEVIERNKTFGDLKQKIFTYYYQLVGKIVLVSYHNFRVIENKKKISEISDRIIEIYQERIYTYQDTVFLKQSRSSLCSNTLNIISIENLTPFPYQQTKINSTMLNGDLFLQIKQNKLIERYTRGVLGYIYGDRIRERSLLTLVSIKIIKVELYLEFKYKNGSQVIVYCFRDAEMLGEFANALLLVVRFYNNQIQVMK